MKLLPNTESNIDLIQEFLSETKKRISNGTTITFTKKSQDELSILAINYNISYDDVETAIINLTPENYYRGIDPSKSADFDVCAFQTSIGSDRVEIYLKYGLENAGLQILVFSNHVPNFPMNQPFKN